MKVRWKKLLVRTILWLALEIWLNFLGLDDVADYSEFIFEKHVTVSATVSFNYTYSEYTRLIANC